MFRINNLVYSMKYLVARKGEYKAWQTGFTITLWVHPQSDLYPWISIMQYLQTLYVLLYVENLRIQVHLHVTRTNWVYSA